MSTNALRGWGAGIALSITAATFIAVTLTYWLFITWPSMHQVAIEYNRFTGEHRLVEKGISASMPWVLSARLDTTPRRVCISSAARAYDCKLVRFVPEHYESLLQSEGFQYYWWYNRISFNFGYERTYRGQDDLMRAYAFSNAQYPFIEVIKE